MTVLDSSQKITSVMFQGLENVILPFTTKILEGALGDVSTYDSGIVNQEDKYFVKSIDGLGPPDQNIAIARTASGGKYQGKTAADREIVAIIGLNPDWDAGETPKFLRDQLYTMINTGYNPKVRISLVAGIFPVSYVDAYVGKMEPVLFTKDPVIQITFECLNSTFQAFEPLTYDPDELDLDYPNIYNPGTAESGFQFAVKFTDTMNHWEIKVAEDQTVGMEFDFDFGVNDILSVSTIPGNRYVHWKKRRGKVQNKMGILKNSSEWIALHPGNNNFVVPKKDKWVWQSQLSFTPLYWGV